MVKNFISYGLKKIDFRRTYKCINHDFLNKPINCFWASPTNSKLSWKKFCIDNDYNIESLSINVKFTLKDNANILCIDTISKYEALPRRSMPKEYSSAMSKRIYIDWEKVLSQYDGIYLDFSALRNACGEDYWLSDRWFILNLDCWDCDTLVLRSLDVIQL